MRAANQAIRAFWAMRGIENPVVATRAQLAQFESTHAVTLPEAVADYFLSVNGTRIGQMGIEDEDMVSFWHLSQIRPLSLWRPGCQLDGSRELLPFADFNIDGLVWVVRLTELGQSPGFLVNGDHAVHVAPSFESFLEAYVARNMDVVFSTSGLP